jgi:ubiquinone/menaquinone biosynthesis C-methylase UbiE
MDLRRALLLLQGANPETNGTWADLGCGEGTFTLALAELLGPAGRVYAVDRDGRALSKLKRRASERRGIVPVLADFTQSFDLPDPDGPVNGLLFANSLHYVDHPERILETWVRKLHPGGQVILVEYDRRAANPWVPYPIPPARLETIATQAGLTHPRVTAREPSAFSGDLYVAVMSRQL